ncbi:MAG: bifunctional phosphoribosylaminoimidazolecarboxamide formyltransferase/IMP cyclohydrolase [Pseudomonadota bacterium]|nr:bifunctional phosphoribosylaminoimidazolecarboxamide formyltransferase/IMP cyclohydrolase [Pseudomonadota bacterium]
MTAAPTLPVTIRRALLSVSDKTGLVDLARALSARGVELLSTGGTARAIRDSGLPVRDVADVTGFPEMMDGRVKTLHPMVHGALLGRAGTDDAVMAQHGIGAIDLLVLNLYPFERVSADPDSTLEDIVENIDIGGPAMLRSAAKNFARVAVATDPAQYADLVRELDANDGALSGRTRFALSVAAFNRVACYDACISNYLSSLQDDGARALFPAQNNSNFVKVMDLRYGENPHQHGAFYRDLWPVPGTLATFTQLQGKELSFNNLADADAAWECVRQFERPACVIVKHANPCGVAQGVACGDAYELAYATDPTSAFGGILAFNTRLDAATTKAILDRQFVEVLIAPDFEPAALDYCRKKANVRVLQIPHGEGRNHFDRVSFDIRRVGSGLLMQTSDIREVGRDELKVVTQRAPSEAELDDLLFAWRIAKFVKSNAIVYARDQRSIGIGAGQMSRVVSARIAGLKADEAGLVVPGSVMASDAFFPFRDGIDAAAAAGIRAVIQPGGSMRDNEVIAAADEHGLAMVFTGVRHFRH